MNSCKMLGRVAGLVRFPVKSMAGESLAEARFGPSGIDGDRRWAVYTQDGGIGSGKTTRRFRRIDGLFELQARLDPSPAPVREPQPEPVPGPVLMVNQPVPTVHLPGGREFRADDPAVDAALSALLGRPLRLRPETSVMHHDESRVHLVTTASIRRLGELLGGPVDVARFRANVVLDVDGTGFVEDDWSGQVIALGDEVRLRLGEGMPRCVMVGLPQPHAGLPAEPRLLQELGRVHEVRFGLKAEVVRTGLVRPGDTATPC